MTPARIELRLTRQATKWLALFIPAYLAVLAVIFFGGAS